MSKERAHSELIKKWADDINLRCFVKTHPGTKWGLIDDKLAPNWLPNNRYFLCPEEHVDVALHWLNGGEVQALKGNCIWDTVVTPNFLEEYTYRAKPTKEKRWIGVRKDGYTTCAHKSKELADGAVATWSTSTGEFQVIEIEVEV